MSQVYGRDEHTDGLEYIRSKLGALFTTSRPLSVRYDQADSTTAYVGEAEPGTAGSAASWRMARLALGTDGDVTKQYADGDDKFDNVWDNRASLTYV